MQELKNCPNCGGILDDTGRCIYCKSKVYDLTDININLDSRDILVMKLKTNGQEVILNCYPTNISIEHHPEFIDISSLDDRGQVYSMARNYTKVCLELNCI